MSQVSNPPSSFGATGPDASELVSRVAQGMHETVDRLADKAAPVAQKLESTVTHANEALHDQMHRAREVGDEWSESLRGTVREHPLASLMVALAAGVLISRLTR